MCLTTFVLLMLPLYVPFHLFEEGMGDFPKWMYEHKWLPYHMSHGHWMANNLFLYYPPLLIVACLYVADARLICCGIAILIWGLVNFGEHTFFTIRDRKVSPGLYTSILFAADAALGFRAYACSAAFSVSGLVAGVIIGVALFVIPIPLCIVAYKFLDKHFA